MCGLLWVFGVRWNHFGFIHAHPVFLMEIAMRFYKLGDILVPESLISLNMSELKDLDKKVAIEVRKALMSGDNELYHVIARYRDCIDAEIVALQASENSTVVVAPTKESNMAQFFTYVMILLFLLVCIFA